MATLNELLPLIDALTPAEKEALAKHLSQRPADAAATPAKRRVVYHPSGRGGPPIARVVMPAKRKP